MDEKTKLESLQKAFAPEKPIKKPRRSKKPLFCLIGGVVGILGGAACILYTILCPQSEADTLNFPELKGNNVSQAIYSKLTGEPLLEQALVDAPAYCVQTPNGADGARPQAGLDQAGVIFEAIAEAGITRFAAIYQNPSTAIIGPIRSLRLYYLQWDTPFDCTIVHAGGASDALAAVQTGGYKDLSENYSYMYRGTYGSRLWNNLFTTSAYLKQASADNGWGSSDMKGFARMTPEESARARVDALAEEPLNIIKSAEGDTSALKDGTSALSIRFGGSPTYNVNYGYDAESNTYRRSYENGTAHQVYSCADGDMGEKNPEDVCTLAQMAPSVVVAMVVSEKRASDNYHEDITTTGSGKAYIFQNGTAIEGKWSKSSIADQIKFTNEAGDEIKLAPGQTFVSAVPSYGSIDY